MYNIIIFFTGSDQEMYDCVLAQELQQQEEKGFEQLQVSNDIVKMVSLSLSLSLCVYVRRL